MKHIPMLQNVYRSFIRETLMSILYNNIFFILLCLTCNNIILNTYYITHIFELSMSVDFHMANE